MTRKHAAHRGSAGADAVAATMVFTVCADAELSTLATEVCEHGADISFAGDFHEYITAGRQFLFPQSIKRARSSVALIDFDKNAEAAVETAEALLRSPSGRVSCVGVASGRDPNLLLCAMRAGCTEFLEKPVDRTLLADAVERMQNRAASLVESSSARGRVITLAGAKGGVGTTTLAVYLALQLARQHGKKTLLVDYRHQLGHVGFYLGLKKNQYHFDQLIRHAERLDANLLHGFVAHHASGLSVLSAPDGCAVRWSVSREEMERILEFLRHEYDYVLFDASLADSEAVPLFQLSDETYLVATPELASLRDLASHLANLNLTEAAKSRLRMVLNRASAKEPIAATQVEKVIAMPVSVSIADGGLELRNALSAGEPLVPRSRGGFSVQVAEWANRLAGPAAPRKHAAVDQPVPRRGRLWGFAG